MRIKTKKKGFSLIELLIMLVIFSLVLLAMMPMITRRHAMVEKVRHGTWICYMDNQNHYRSALIKGSNVIWDNDTGNKCEFNNIPKKVKVFHVQVIGGGAGGYSVNKDPRSNSDIRIYQTRNNQSESYTFNFDNKQNDYRQFKYQGTFDSESHLENDIDSIQHYEAEDLFNRLTDVYRPLTNSSNATKIANKMPLAYVTKAANGSVITAKKYRAKRDLEMSYSGTLLSSYGGPLAPYYMYKIYLPSTVNQPFSLTFWGVGDQNQNAKIYFNGIHAPYGPDGTDYSYMCYSAKDVYDYTYCMNNLLGYDVDTLASEVYKNENNKQKFIETYNAITQSYDHCTYSGSYLTITDKSGEEYKPIKGYSGVANPSEDDYGRACYENGKKPIYFLQDNETSESSLITCGGDNKCYPDGSDGYSVRYLTRIPWYFGMTKDTNEYSGESYLYDADNKVTYSFYTTSYATGNPTTQDVGTYRAQSGNTKEILWELGGNTVYRNFVYGSAGAILPPSWGLYYMLMGAIHESNGFTNNASNADAHPLTLTEYQHFKSIFRGIFGGNNNSDKYEQTFIVKDKDVNSYSPHTCQDGSLRSCRTNIDAESPWEKLDEDNTIQSNEYISSLYTDYNPENMSTYNASANDSNDARQYGYYTPTITKQFYYASQNLYYGKGGKAGDVKTQRLSELTEDQINNIHLGQGGKKGYYNSTSDHGAPTKGENTTFNNLTANGGTLFGDNNMSAGIVKYEQEVPLTAVNPADWPGNEVDTNAFFKKNNGYYDYDIWIGGYSSVKTYFSFIVKLVDNLTIHGSNGNQNIFDFFKEIGHGGQGDMLGTHCNYGAKYLTENLTDGNYVQAYLQDILGLSPNGWEDMKNSSCNSNYAYTFINGNGTVGYYDGAIYRVKEAEDGRNGAVIISW